jgi:hypothetical protein
MTFAEPRIALEKLLEIRFHTHRSAFIQREMVRLKPETRKPYTADPETAAARKAAGYILEGSMADELFSLADFFDDIVFGLDRASAYFWTDAMTALVIEAASRMPRYSFTESSFPTPEGFVWHASPHSIDGVVPEGELSSDDRINLFFEQSPLVKQARRTRRRDWVGDDDDLESLQRMFRETSADDLKPLPLQAWGWRRDASAGPDAVHLLSWHYVPSQVVGGEDEWRVHRTLHVRYGQTLEDIVDETKGRDWKAFGAIAACALALMEQTLLVPGHVHVPRALAKRYQHSLNSMQEPNLRIVELRKRETLPANPYEAREVEWQHRWFVRAHWRQQRHPTTRAYKPVFVHAYVKGPEGKPLLPPRQTIFSVDR